MPNLFKAIPIRFVVFLSLGLTLFNNFTYAQEKTVTYYADPAAIPPDLSVTLKHITARVSFKPEENKVAGAAEFRFIPNRYTTDSIVFHCPDFKVSSVTIEGKPANFFLLKNTLNILPDPSLLVKGRESFLEVVYEAIPMSGPIYFIGWRPEEAGKRKAIWAHRSSGWLPYMDARLTMDIFITFDKSYKVFSNGERVDIKDNSDGTLTWHYAMRKNHPFFSTALVIGDYNYKTSATSRGVPLEYWYYSDMADRVSTTYRYTEQMFDFFEKEMGVNYPYPVYREAPVIDYMYGAMETTTSTVFGDYMLIEPRAWWQRNYVNVNAHELAHQWFGNYIGHFVHKDVWLTESFGTYYAKVFEKSIFGDDYYQGIRNDELTQTFEAARKNNYPVGGTQGGVQRIYQKGSLVLDMLRDVMGEKEFRDAVKHYLEKYGFNYAETSDFVRCVYDVTGKPYNWFFDEWVYRGGEPTYKVSYVVSDDTLGNRNTRVQVWQVHETNELTGLFKMPVEFEVHYKDGTFDRKQQWIENKFSEVSIQNPSEKQIAFVLFDPNRRILKKVIFDRTFDELSAQLTRAENMIDRYDALVALKTTPIDKKSTMLAEAFSRESFLLMKTEILDQLAGTFQGSSIHVFAKALQDPDANVRKAALKGMVLVPDTLQAAVEACLNDSSWLNIELALNTLCISFPQKKEAYLDQTRSLEGWRGKNIRMKWLEISALSGKREPIQELIDYTGPKFEFETRINAFLTLKKLRYTDKEVTNNAILASKHWNNKLSAAAREYLSYFN